MRCPVCCGLSLSYFLLAIVVCAGCSLSSVTSLSERQQALEQLEAALASGKSAANGDPAAASQRTGRELLTRIDTALTREQSNRRLSSSTNAAWQIMHGVICYGSELQIETPDQGLVGALDYAFHGGQINGFELSLGRTPLSATGRTGVMARLEPGSYLGQGHPDQWLAIFAMAELPPETEVVIGDTTRTLLDWARQAQWDVSHNLLSEYSWTLIGLTHYLPNEPSWVMANGSTVSWEDLVSAELKNDLDASACGGTHRLAGLVRALNAKQSLGLPDSDVWRRAQLAVEQAIANAKANRGSDGSLSSYYFVRPSKTVDFAAELASSGHLFEFLALALPAEELSEPWVELAAGRLCDVLEATQEVELDCGALYHALNGLRIYRQRHP